MACQYFHEWYKISANHMEHWHNEFSLYMRYKTSSLIVTGYSAFFQCSVQCHTGFFLGWGNFITDKVSYALNEIHAILYIIMGVLKNIWIVFLGGGNFMPGWSPPFPLCIKPCNGFSISVIVTIDLMIMFAMQINFIFISFILSTLLE